MTITLSLLRWMSRPVITVEKTVDRNLKKCYYVGNGVVGYSICYYDRQYFSHLWTNIQYDKIEIWFWKEPEETAPTLTQLICRTYKLVAIYNCYIIVNDIKNWPKTLYHTSSIPIISRFIDKLAKMIKTTNHREKTLSKMIDLLSRYSKKGDQV